MFACSGELQGWDGQGIRQMLREAGVFQGIGFLDFYVMIAAKGYEPDSRPAMLCGQRIRAR